MATTEHNGLMVYKDESGNLRVLYPVTKADLVDGLDELFEAQTEATDAKLANKSDTSHNHDSRYYTESEINTKLANKADTSALAAYARTQVGTYTGAGNAGQNNAISLTFNFTPKMVFIALSTSSLLRGNTYAMSSTFGVIYDQLTESYVAFNSFRSDKITIKKSGNTMTWYGANAEGQLNTSGAVYHYIAIG